MTPCLAVSYEPRVHKNSFDCWAISVPYQAMVTVDTEAMHAYFRILEDAKLVPADGVTREQAGIEEASDRIFVAYYSGQTREGGQAEPDRGMTFRFGNQEEAGNYYVETGGKLWLADQAAVDKLFEINPYELILKVMSVAFERNREDAPKIIQRYYAFDGTYASVRVNGTEFFLVSREALASVQEKLRDEERAFGGNS